jgi:hypothetical protein
MAGLIYLVVDSDDEPTHIDWMNTTMHTWHENYEIVYLTGKKPHDIPRHYQPCRQPSKALLL